ncbi:hypothetical protein [Parasphingopyxis marina]|uniref:DoxX family protein n=1 Tax=Parasphingopyxis marina TaxID=2761622 RepID=A0A842I1A5_9SPHN|nr:hypothetical protein [Parasphingopyxis marina]MBC2778925.1 hypothetical protein [Parasphingopyxis marina]
MERKGWDHYAIMWLRLWFGVHLFYSGVRYFVEFQAQPQVPHPIGGPFIDSLYAMGLFPIIKVLEIVVGAGLLANRLVPMLLVLEMPVSAMIFYLNTLIVGTPRQLVSGPLELGVNIALLLCYFGYFRPMLVARAQPAPAWRRGEADV